MNNLKEILTKRYAKWKFEPEVDGRIFFITDIHGQYKMLQDVTKFLRFVNFPRPDQKPDYLINLGDMCDRGEGSFDVLTAFKDNPNFKSLEGNHEKLMFNGTRKPPYQSAANTGIEARGERREHWMINGGEWMYNHDFNSVRSLADWTETLPFAAEIHIGDKVIGLSHASVAPNEIFESGAENDWFENREVDWENTRKAAMIAGDDKQDFMYREMMEYCLTFCRKAERQKIELNVKGVDAVLHGHCVQEYEPLILGKTLYFDNGAFISDLYEKKHFMNVLEYAPDDKDAIFGMFRLYQFYYDENKMLCLK